MDWKDLAGTLVKAGAPIIGTAIGGPIGGTIGGAAAAVTTAPGSGAHGILGYCLKASSDTNSTGMLGVVYVDISRYVTTA